MSLVARCCSFELGLLRNYVFLQATYDLYKVVKNAVTYKDIWEGC